MDKEEFIRVCNSCGYAKKKLAKEYADNHPKEEYDIDDIIAVHRMNKNFKGNHTCGISYITNGKTTAFQNA